MAEDIKTKKGDFVEIEYVGFHNGKPFDSNIESYLKEINPKADTPQKTIVAIGEGMVVPGLDMALENKETGKEYEAHIPYKEGFGSRKRELVKTIPLHIFTDQKINPRPGSTLFMDNAIARVITISGARVLTDFNNPLAGKDLHYKFTITRILNKKDEKEKVEAIFRFYLRNVPDFELSENKIVVRGPEILENIVKIYSERFKKLLGKELEFKKQEKTEKKAEESKSGKEKELQ